MNRDIVSMLGALGALCIIIASLYGLTHLLLHHSVQAPQVAAQQKSERAPDGERDADKRANSGPKTSFDGRAANGNDDESKADQREQKGTEFWPTFLGLRLKITDSLLAAFTFVLAIFTGLLWRSPNKLWEAADQQSKDMKRSITIADKALISTDRPRITVRRVVLVGLEPNRPVAVQFLFVNTGAGVARIVEYNATIAIMGGLPPIPNYDPHGTKRDEIRLESGVAFPIVARGFQNISDHTIGEINHFLQNGLRIYVFGYAQYRDGAGTLRHMGFGRVWDHTRRFSPSHDPEYEYAD